MGRRPGPARRWLAVVVATTALLAACSDSDPTPPPPTTALVAAATTSPPATSTSAPAVATTSTVAPAPTTTVTEVAGSSFIGTVAAVTAADLGASWRPGCPVAPDDLRLLRLSYWGFDDRPDVGSLVVAASVADAIVDVFRTLYDQHFPIRRMVPVDAYGGDDDASMAADNTSAFNCRPAVAEGPPHWSNHAYGLAVDVNPLENPYLLSGKVLPPGGAEFVDRSVYRPGMAVPGGVLISAFAAVGWGWGGTWSSPDYQHFSSNGG